MTVSNVIIAGSEDYVIVTGTTDPMVANGLVVIVQYH